MSLRKKSRGEMHEGLHSKIFQWPKNGLDEIDEDFKTLFPKMEKILLSKHTNDPCLPKKLVDIDWKRQMSLAAWPPNYAGEKACFNNVYGSGDRSCDGDDSKDDDDNEDSELDSDDSEDDDEDGPNEILTAKEEQKELWILTELLSDLVYGMKDSVGRWWMDTYERSADVNAAKEDMSDVDNLKAVKNTIKILDEFQGTDGDPFNTVRYMNLNENSVAFTNGSNSKYGDMRGLIESKGYKLFHEFYYVGAYWYENHDCQVSFIFLHKPWYLAFTSHKIWERNPFSQTEINTHASVAKTIQWQQSIFEMFEATKFDLKLSNKLTGVLPAFVLRTYCLQNAHLSPFVCTLIAKALMLYPRRVYPCKTTTMKAKFISDKSRTMAYRKSTKPYYGHVEKKEVFRCSTTMNVAESDLVKWAVGKLNTKHKKEIERYKSHFKESFVEKMRKEYNENLDAKAGETMSKEKARVEELRRKQAERRKAK